MCENQIIDFGNKCTLSIEQLTRLYDAINTELDVYKEGTLKVYLFIFLFLYIYIYIYMYIYKNRNSSTLMKVIM